SLSTGKTEDRLIKPLKEGEAQMRFYVKNEDLYDCIRAEHEVAGHAGRNKVIPLLKKKYANVTQLKKKKKFQEAILLFLSLCGICEAKKKSKKRGIVPVM
ncbi:KRAB-A domain-containing protein 2, partial [Frankliniella fusca]